MSLKWALGEAATAFARRAVKVWSTVSLSPTTSTSYGAVPRAIGEKDGDLEVERGPRGTVVVHGRAAIPDRAATCQVDAQMAAISDKLAATL